MNTDACVMGTLCELENHILTREHATISLERFFRIMEQLLGR